MKHIMTKKYIMVTAVLVCLLLFFFASESRAGEPEKGEVVILIDSSGSVRGHEDEIREWAESLGAYVQGMGVCVDLRSFGNPGNIKNLYRDVIEISEKDNEKSDLEIYMDALSVVGADDKWTDQKGAMEDAIQTLNSSDAQKKCIIMLSDGRLDYESDEKEEDARDEFVSMVDDFAREKDHEIILVRFGLEDEIFKRCREATVLEGKEFLEPALQEISKELGIKVEKGAGERQGDNQISFQLEEKDYYRVILNIRAASNEKKISREEIDEITVFNEGNLLKKDACSLLDHSCYIYLENPAPGNYTVSLPDNKWNFYYVSQEKIKVSDIYLSVLQDGKAVEEKEGIYQICGEKCTLEIEISSDPAGQLQSGNVQYRVFGLDEKYKGVQGSSKNGIYEQALVLNGDEEVYECQVKVQQGEMEEESEIISIKVNKTPPPTPSPTSVISPTKSDKVVGEAFNLKSEFGVNDSEENCFVYMDGEKVFQMNTSAAADAEGAWKYENGELTFLKEMEVTVEVKSDERSWGIKEYIVKDDSFCTKIKKWFEEMFQ